MMMTLTSQLENQKLLDTQLSKVKGRLFTKKGGAWLSSLMCSHKYRWTFEVDTAATDGEFIYWNPEFFKTLRLEARITVLAHELYHTGLGHMLRIGNRCPRIWNIAGDYVINGMLDNAGYSFDMPIKPYLDHRFDDMTTEEVYDILVSEGEVPFQKPNEADGDIPMTGDIQMPKTAAEKRMVKTIIVQAKQAAQAAKEAGFIPGESSFFIDSFLKPKLNWRILLRRYFTALAQDDYSWKRPSRRYDEYLPSMISDNGLEHLIYYLDVSGSIAAQEIKRFNSEVRFIHKTLRPQRLTLVTFDTKIQDVYEFVQGQKFEDITVHGRGGTCLKCVHDHIKQHKPTAAVIFSDLYVKPMVENPGSPLIWVVMNNPSAQVNFGKMVHLEPEDLAT